MKKNIFVTHAVKEEFFPIEVEGCEMTHIYTGVGKTKSAHILTKHICKAKPDLVLNIGTAGTVNHKVGDIFVSTHFFDRDYENIRLPGVEHEIDALPLLKGKPALKKWIENQDEGICNTGDSFVTQTEGIKGDVIDMEAYSQAYVCKEFDIPFVAIKYVTDVIGQNSVELWESRLNEARQKLSAWVKEKNLIESLE